MKDDSGHFGEAPQPRLPDPGQPRTRDESRAWADRWRAQANAPMEYVPGELMVSAAPAAWQSIPKPIRFAVWLGALWVIVGFAVFCVAVVAWVLGMGFALSQL